MEKPWNLTPKEWSSVLQTEDDPERTAKNIKTEKLLPWVKNLIDLTAGYKTVLDLGSGAGQNSAALALRGKKVSLLDWSKENIDFSRKLFSSLNLPANFFQLDLTKALPFSDKSYDCIFSCGVFEYFEDKQIKDILKEALRVARKRVIIMVPNAYSLPYRFGMWYMRLKGRWLWGGERPFYSFKKYFKEAGFATTYEFSVAAKHSLNFLNIPFGRFIRKALTLFFRMKEHSKPSFFNQGYLLISVGEK